MEDGVAIDISPNKCFHYKDKADIVISNAIYEYSHTGVHKKHRAYKKCSGNNMEIFDFGNNNYQLDKALFTFNLFISN